MSGVERQVLQAPDVVARAAAAAVRDRRVRWMLRQPRRVRVAFAREVHGRPDEDERSAAWMLRQPADVRESYVRHVLRDRTDRAAREERWMLLQDDEVRLSYLEQVLREAG